MISDVYNSNSLEFSGDLLDRFNAVDVNPPGIVEITGISQHGMATASGLKKDDYQQMGSLVMGLLDVQQVATVNKIPIPSEVVEHFRHIKCHCMMGLFAEIGRAWLTIDSDIYIWTYENSRDVAYFDGLSHLITSVGIVKPKTSVFVPDIKYLLILATTIEIVILGVTFDNTTKTSMSTSQQNSSHEEMQLINKPIFVLSTDNVTITTIEGTADGRIFFGGSDGCLYEIIYQAESNWLGKRCKKVNLSQSLMSFMVPGFLKAFNEVDPIVKIAVDNSRKYLYTLSERGTIEAWTLGNDHSAIRRISRLTQNEIFQKASNIFKSIDESALKPVTAICPLSKTDNTKMHLIAVTQSGARFYFTTTSLQNPAMLSTTTGGMPVAEAARQPNGLFLLHVRMPPGYDTPNTTLHQPKNIHTAFQCAGSFLMVSSTQQDKDLLWSLNSQLFPFSDVNRQFTESNTKVPLDGQVWSVAEVKDNICGNLQENFQTVYQKPSRIVLLTNQGAHILELLKPVNVLQQILLACHNPNHDAVKTYFQIHTEAEACATSVAIACLDYLKGSELSFWATQAFLFYGNRPEFDNQQQQDPRMASKMLRDPNRSLMDPGSPRALSTPLATRPQKTLASPLQSPTFTSPNLHRHVQPEVRQVRYPAKYSGLYIHLARIIRPIWGLKCIIQKNQSSITPYDCNLILNDLYAFKSFLDSNPIITSTANSSLANQQHRNDTTARYEMSMMGNSPDYRNRNLQEDAFAEERLSIEALIRLVTHACEVIGLWKILCEHQLHTLFSNITIEYQNLLLSCNYRDLILFRSDICAVLIVALINTYLGDNASLGPVSAKLREVCPMLYRHEDAISHKATELLILAKNTQDTDEKDVKLQTALRLCKDAAPNIPLSSICEQFVSAEFYNGVIELCAICASKLDPSDAATYYSKNNDKLEDQEGYLAYTARLNCYKEIKTMLEKIYNLCMNTLAMDVGASNEENNNAFSKRIIPIITMALQQSDQFLHFSIYEWLLEHNLLGRWLDISEPSLGEYLSQAVVKNPDNLLLADLLWKYYEKNLQHSAAAKILLNLATMHSNSLSIDQRYEYLARAVMCMRNSNVGSASQNGILLKDLEDKLEIARVQKFILDSINSNNHINDHEKQDALQELNATLYEMTDLYCKFAERFNLWECKLTILNCANYNDALLIESVWAKILDEELEFAGTGVNKGERMISKVKYLAREHGTNSHCFPITFLVHELEIRCCKLAIDPSPVPINLLDMDIDVGLILDVYSRLISLNERVWSSYGDENYLIKSCNRLTAQLAANPNLFIKNRLKIFAKIQDLTSACLNLLYTNTNTDSKNVIDALIQAIRETQIKIQRNL